MTEAEKLEKTRLERKESILKELAELAPDENFIPPDGLLIPFGDEVVVLPVMQNEHKRASGIILQAIGDAANDRKIGIIARIGPDCRKPLFIGMKVLFESRGNHFRVNGADGNEYLVMLEHHIYGAATPSTYVVPEFLTKLQKRDNSRREGFKVVEAAEKKALNGETEGQA